MAASRTNMIKIHKSSNHNRITFKLHRFCLMQWASFKKIPHPQGHANGTIPYKWQKVYRTAGQKPYNLQTSQRYCVIYGIPFEEMAGVKHGWPYACNGAIPYKYQKIYLKHPTKIVQQWHYIVSHTSITFKRNRCTCIDMITSKIFTPVIPPIVFTWLRNNTLPRRFSWMWCTLSVKKGRLKRSALILVGRKKVGKHKSRQKVTKIL